MKKVLYAIKKVFTVIILLIGAFELVFIVWAGILIYDRETLHFDRWNIYEKSPSPFNYEENEKGKEEYERLINRIKEGGYVIEAFNFEGGAAYWDQALCYNEIAGACDMYANQVAEKYEWKAKLHIELEYTPKTFTVYCTGWGYPENGEPECLDRTYIYDIEGAGPDKLPVLLNKDEIYY